MKHVKMVLYGEPGVGKSVFASKAPNPFFITTDGNYEFLEDFGAKAEDHIQINSWAEAKKAFTRDYSNYDTIVVDLTEDLFKWCEYEYCKLNGYEHVSDIGFGKGYDITRNDFFINLCKLLNQEKNIILIMHGLSYTIKDRKGIEITKHGPTNRIPDKVLDMIEGRVRYFLRAYLKAEEVDNKLVKKRYLSLIPKENEYGILRGIDENTIPGDIPLERDVFADLINLENYSSDKKSKKDKEKKLVKDIPSSSIEKFLESKEDSNTLIKEEKQVNDKEEKQLDNKEEKSNNDNSGVLSQKEKLAAIQAKMAKINASKAKGE